MKITTKLISALAVMSVAMTATFLAWFVTWQDEQAGIATIVNDRVTPIHELFMIARNLGLIRSELPRLSGDADSDQESIQRIEEWRREIDAQWSDYAKTRLTAEEQVLARRAHKVLATVETSLTRLIEVHESPGGAGALLEIGQHLNPAVADLQSEIARLVDLQERVSYAEYEATERTFRRGIVVMGLAAFMAATALAYAAFIFRRSILGPIAGARAALTRIAQGQPDVAIPHSDSSEIEAFLADLRDLGKRFSGMRAEQVVDRRQVEQFKARLEAVFKHCPFGIFIKDLDGRFIMLNEAEAAIWGHPAEVFIGRQSQDFVPEKDLPRVLETDRKVSEAGESVVVDYRGTTQTSYEWLQTVKFPITGSGGELIAVGGIDIDISERKRHEAALRRYGYHLDRAGSLAKIMFWILRTDGATGVRTREYNAERMTEWCGWNKLPVDHGTYIDEFIYPADQETVRNIYQGFEAGSYDNYVVEYRLRRADGSYFPVRSWRERTVDPISGNTDVFALAQDITDERERQSDLMAALRRAEAADRAKTDFLRIMSHELRTPLNPIIGFSELLSIKFQQQGDTATVEQLKNIHDGAHNLLSIISVILEFSRLDAAGAELDEVEFGLGPSLARAIDSLAARADEIGAVLDVAVEPEDIKIRGDEAAFRQAVGNILSNSLRFSPVGALVQVTAHQSGNEIRISISDQGPGFDKDVIAQLDKPFVRGGDALSQRHGGVGLGIIIARKIMELHSGRLEIVNAASGGACVTLVFPVSGRMTGPLRR